MSWDSEDEKEQRNKPLYKLRDAALRLMVNANVDQGNRLVGLVHGLELALEEASVPTERVATAFALDVMDNLRLTWVQANAKPTEATPHAGGSEKA